MGQTKVPKMIRESLVGFDEDSGELLYYFGRDKLLTVTDVFTCSEDDAVYREVLAVLKDDFQITDMNTIVLVKRATGYTEVYRRRERRIK